MVPYPGVLDHRAICGALGVLPGYNFLLGPSPSPPHVQQRSGCCLFVVPSATGGAAITWFEPPPPPPPPKGAPLAQRTKGKGREGVW